MTNIILKTESDSLPIEQANQTVRRKALDHYNRSMLMATIDKLCDYIANSEMAIALAQSNLRRAMEPPIEEEEDN